VTGPESGSGAGAESDSLRPFDPLRAVSDVQRQAIDNAGRIIGRLLNVMDGAPSDRDALEVPAGDGEDRPEPGFQQIRANVARAIDLYMDLFQRTFEAYADLTEAALRRRDVTIGGDGAGPSPAAPLTLRIAEDGVAEGEVWLHNATGAPVGPDRVGTTPLSSHTGDVISAGDVLIDPHVLPALPPGESARATVRVDTSRVPPGRYHGHLLTPRAALAVDLTVPE
jgi:hypothetical protein